MFKGKNILFLGLGNKAWIGGLYYVKNIIYTLVKENKLESSKIYIFVKSENKHIFKSLLRYENIKIIEFNDNLFNKIICRASQLVLKRILNIELLLKVKKYNIDYIYPVSEYSYIGLLNKIIFWIPDFQYIHLPEMFTHENIKLRNELNKYIAKYHKYLILSSNDAFLDYKKLYPDCTNGVIVEHFMSDIQDDIKDINDKYIKDVLNKYSISYKYFIVCNQFWKHKNHITVFRAINQLVNEDNKDVKLICTGNTNDYRNANYFNELKDYIKENNLEKNIIILGLIPRKEQLVLIINSIAVIQPSLFEGWGTVVEDSKALDKKIILSDINVHFEQKNNNCYIFKKENFNELANIISSFIS